MNAPANLAQDEAFARIRLLRSPNVGPISYSQLLRRFGTAQAALEALPDLAARGRRDYRPAPRERIEGEVAAVRAAGARYLFHDSPGYPALLAEIESAPPILTVLGDPHLAAKPCVAIVGARNASAAAVKLSGFDGTPRSSFREAQPHHFGGDEELLADEPADIAALLTTAPIGVDELVRQSAASAGAVQMALLELEIAGRSGAACGGTRLARVRIVAMAGLTG